MLELLVLAFKCYHVFENSLRFRQANEVLTSIDLGVRQTRLVRWIRLPPVNVVNSGKVFITSGCLSFLRWRKYCYLSPRFVVRIKVIATGNVLCNMHSSAY